jgi:hypothetical protein
MEQPRQVTQHPTAPCLMFFNDHGPIATIHRLYLHEHQLEKGETRNEVEDEKAPDNDENEDGVSLD